MKQKASVGIYSCLDVVVGIDVDVPLSLAPVLSCSLSFPPSLPPPSLSPTHPHQERRRCTVSAPTQASARAPLAAAVRKTKHIQAARRPH